MTRLNALVERARPWWDNQPALLKQVLTDLSNAHFDLAWTATPGGMLEGRLPPWPFERPVPELLDELVPQGLLVEVHLGQSFPMLCPKVFPQDPMPPFERWTQHRWHVNGDGSVCQLQSADAWDPSTSVVDVLRKAAGWRIEYALVEADVVQAMSLSGIVSDDWHDGRVTEAARAIVAARAIPDDKQRSA